MSEAGADLRLTGRWRLRADGDKVILCVEERAPQRFGRGLPYPDALQGQPQWRDATCDDIMNCRLDMMHGDNNNPDRTSPINTRSGLFGRLLLVITILVFVIASAGAPLFLKMLEGR